MSNIQLWNGGKVVVVVRLKSKMIVTDALEVVVEVACYLEVPMAVDCSVCVVKRLLRNDGLTL